MRLVGRQGPSVSCIVASLFDCGCSNVMWPLGAAYMEGQRVFFVTPLPGSYSCPGRHLPVQNESGYVFRHTYRPTPHPYTAAADHSALTRASTHPAQPQAAPSVLSRECISASLDRGRTSRREAPRKPRSLLAGRGHHHVPHAQRVRSGRQHLQPGRTAVPSRVRHRGDQGAWSRGGRMVAWRAARCAQRARAGRLPLPHTDTLPCGSVQAAVSLFSHSLPHTAGAYHAAHPRIRSSGRPRSAWQPARAWCWRWRSA
jgi:hypothetical protein